MQKTNVYIISGLGAGSKVFSNINWPTHLQPIFIDWLIPTHASELLLAYAKRMAASIHDQPYNFYLLGYSFGGVVAQEIHQFLPAKKVILIASIQQATEKHFLLNFINTTKLDVLVPPQFYTGQGIFSYAFFRKIYKTNLPKLHTFIEQANKHYIKWAIRQLLAWKPTRICNKQPIIQIMGSKDPLFVASKTKAQYIIPHANHLLVYLKSKQLEPIIHTEFA